ncbi:MAG: hypothetical protein NVSMB18_22740 [Acetobacteraceae bacterium]
MPRVALLDYVLVITRIGLTSFGGGVSGWMMRVIVHERGWLSESEFLVGLSLCQMFPGINVLNLAIWIGYRLQGGAGALAGALAMIVPPGLVLIALGAAFGELAQFASVRVALNGVAAAAIGLGASMGVRAARLSATGALPVAVMVAVFAAIGLLHWPLVPVVAVAAPLSIGLAAWQGMQRGQGAR